MAKVSCVVPFKIRDIHILPYLMRSNYEIIPFFVEGEQKKSQALKWLTSTSHSLAKQLICKCIFSFVSFSNASAGKVNGNVFQ